MMPSTWSGPRASAASMALRLESTPPERPTTTRSRPTLRTSFRMNATRIRRMSETLVGIMALYSRRMRSSSRMVRSTSSSRISGARVRLRRTTSWDTSPATKASS